MEDIHQTEVLIKEKSQTDKRNFVLDYLHAHTDVNCDGDLVTTFLVKGKPICKDAWLIIYDLKKDTFNRLSTQFKEGVVQVEHGHTGTKWTTQKTKDYIAWLEFFVGCVGQHQPDKKSIHLPSCFSLSLIYKQMVDENNTFKMPSVSKSQFYRIFHRYFPHVQIPKVSTCILSQ